MSSAPRQVVTIRYTLTDGAGRALESPDRGRPITALQGSGQLVPGLERALAGRCSGETLTVSVPAAEGYGPHDERRVRTLPRGKLPDKVAVGSRCRVQTEEGFLPALITALEPEVATVDLNHPLAGVALCFAVEVIEVRDATADELAHGHAHGPGGHH